MTNRAKRQHIHQILTFYFSNKYWFCSNRMFSTYWDQFIIDISVIWKCVTFGSFSFSIATWRTHMWHVYSIHSLWIIFNRKFTFTSHGTTRQLYAHQAIFWLIIIVCAILPTVPYACMWHNYNIKSIVIRLNMCGIIVCMYLCMYV